MDKSNRNVEEGPLTDEELESLIARRLTQVRTLAKLTQGQVAKYENKSKSYISKLEDGKYTPNVWVLLSRIMFRYKQRGNFTADYVLGLTDDMEAFDKKSLPSDFLELWEMYQQMPSELQGRFMLIARVMAGDLWGVSGDAAMQIIKEHAARLIERDGEGAADELLATLAEASMSGDRVAIQRLLARIVGNEQTE